MGGPFQSSFPTPRTPGWPLLESWRCVGVVHGTGAGVGLPHLPPRLCPRLGAGGVCPQGLSSTVTTTPPLGAKEASRGSSSCTLFCALLTVVVLLCVMALQPPSSFPQINKDRQSNGPMASWREG